MMTLFSGVGCHTSLTAITNLDGKLQFRAGKALGEYWNCHSVSGVFSAQAFTTLAPLTAISMIPPCPS